MKNRPYAVWRFDGARGIAVAVYIEHKSRLLVVFQTVIILLYVREEITLVILSPSVTTIPPTEL